MKGENVKENLENYTRNHTRDHLWDGLKLSAKNEFMENFVTSLRHTMDNISTLS